jgi:ABC-type transport system substrate-binding protein
MIDRRTFVGGASAAALGTAVLPALASASLPEALPVSTKILRVPFVGAETGFDPARISDLYSRTVTAHIFEALYGYDPLAMPVKVRPLTAAEMPEVSEDFRVWTVKVRPGIYFADDPAFKGKPRELVAEDYVYTIKRFFDPAVKSPAYSGLSEEHIEGIEAPREKALAEKKPFDYDRPVAGLRALDRYTLQVRLTETRPRFLSSNLCSSSTLGAVAREVVEFYGEEIMAHPVGTGPYRLKDWKRSSRIVLERNPDFREMLYDAEPADDDAQGQAWLAKFRGRRLPFNDGVEIFILEEGQPRWLSFLNGEIDYVRVPAEYTTFAMPNGKLAPNLVKKKILARRYVNSDLTMSYFNMDDPVVGGYTPEKVALRRAIAMAYDVDREIRTIRRGSAIPAQGPIVPGTFGYDAQFRSENSQPDPARANALLDTYGYLDRNGDGWRELPDGSPLEVHYYTQPSQLDRQLNECWQASLTAIGVKMKFITAQWPENMKAARAGKLQMWGLGSTAGTPDGQPGLEYFYGPSIGSANLAHFKNADFDAIYRRMSLLPDGPERKALFIEATKIALVFMPYKIQVHRIYIDLNHPWITGWRQGMFRDEQWQFVEVNR